MAKAGYDNDSSTYFVLRIGTDIRATPMRLCVCAAQSEYRVSSRSAQRCRDLLSLQRGQSLSRRAYASDGYQHGWVGSTASHRV